MKLDTFISAVCNELKALPDDEKEAKLHRYGDIARAGCINVDFDIPVKSNDSGVIEVAFGDSAGGENVRIKFSLTFWRYFGDGPTHRQAESKSADA